MASIQPSNDQLKLTPRHYDSYPPKFINMITRILILISIPTLFLSACGGGGQDAFSSTATTRCAETYSYQANWRINGSFATFQRLDGKVGVPMTATLTLSGLSPAQCVGLQTFALGKGVVLPKGLTLNATTGTISGTPTEAKILEGVPIVEVFFPGFQFGSDTLSTLYIEP